MTIYQYGCGDTSECKPVRVYIERGRYRFECWGAQGGSGVINGKIATEGGHGSYTSGEKAKK